MLEEQKLNESTPFPVATRARSCRPPRDAVAGRCRTKFDQFRRSLLSRRLPGTRLTVESALATALASQPNDPLALKVIAALASAGITIVDAYQTDEMEPAVPHIQLDPRELRATYPRSARLEPHTFVMTLPIGSVSDCRVHEQDEDVDFDFMIHDQVGTRYAGGVSDSDQLRIQVEVLRQTLVEVGITIDAALDALCAGLQSPGDETREQCNRLVRELEGCGLRFHAVQKSWRLPRAGVLLLEQPEALVRAYPPLAFFEPHRFGWLAFVDRPARAGGEVRQGLLF